MQLAPRPMLFEIIASRPREPKSSLSTKIEDQRVSVRRILQGRTNKIINNKFLFLGPSLTMHHDIIPFSLFCLFLMLRKVEQPLWLKTSSVLFTYRRKKTSPHFIQCLDLSLSVLLIWLKSFVFFSFFFRHILLCRFQIFYSVDQVKVFRPEPVIGKVIIVSSQLFATFSSFRNHSLCLSV